MSIFVLKIIAVFFMVVDHVKYALPSCVNEFTLYFGRISFPIFAFCIVQGYLHTHDIKKYLERLLIAGAISEVPYLLFNSLPTLEFINLNIMFSFALGILSIKSYEFYGGRWKGILAVLMIAIIAEISKVDYGVFGILLIFSFYIFRNSKYKMFIASFCVVAGKYLYRILVLQIGFKEYPIKNWICTSIPLLIVLLYNGKKGPGLKWFFYIFYPVHFFILWLISPYAINLLHLSI